MNTRTVLERAPVTGTPSVEWADPEALVFVELPPCPSSYVRQNRQKAMIKTVGQLLDAFIEKEA